MDIVDYSLQTTVNVAVENCALFMYLCYTLKKARFALQGHTPTCSFLSRSRCQGPAYRWSNDLRSFDLCTTLIRLYFIPSPPVCLKYINIAKCQIRVWEKLETNQLCFQPTSKSEVVFFLPSATQNLLDMGSNCFSEVKFLGCFKIASMLFSPLCFFPRSLGQFQDYPVIISISAGDNEWRGTYVTCSMVTLQPSLLCRGASGMLSIRGLRFLERKIWGFFLRAKLHSPNKWSNMQEEKCLINVFILLKISF